MVIFVSLKIGWRVKAINPVWRTQNQKRNTKRFLEITNINQRWSVLTNRTINSNSPQKHSLGTCNSLRISHQEVANPPQFNSSGVIVATDLPWILRGYSQVAAAWALPDSAYVFSSSASHRISQSQWRAFESNRLHKTRSSQSSVSKPQPFC